MKLNQRQKLFCEYYVGECKGNAADAMIKAGYSEKFAKNNTGKLLNNVKICEYITNLNNEVTKNNTNSHIATIEEIHAFWTEIFNDVTVSTRDRLKASELLAKCKGAFNNDW